MHAKHVRPPESEVSRLRAKSGDFALRLAFADNLGVHTTDLDNVIARLVEVVQETMQPESVSLWLRPTAGGRPPQSAVSRRSSVVIPGGQSGEQA